jgi:hypothetical protein
MGILAGIRAGAGADRPLKCGNLRNPSNEQDRFLSGNNGGGGWGLGLHGRLADNKITVRYSEPSQLEKASTFQRPTPFCQAKFGECVRADHHTVNTVGKQCRERFSKRDKAG